MKALKEKKRGFKNRRWRKSKTVIKKESRDREKERIKQPLQRVINGKDRESKRKIE